MKGCDRCGRLDASLRGASYMYAISVVLVTFTEGAAAGNYCRSCRFWLATGYSTLSAVLGWWGLPWGPIRTIHALGHNAGGGFQKRDYQAGLLRAVARELMERDDKHGAAAALEESLKYREDPALHELLWQLAGEATQEVATTATTVHSPGDLVRCLTLGEPLRAAPGAVHEPVGVLDDDAVVTRADADWVEVRALRGGIGWVRADAVEARA